MSKAFLQPSPKVPTPILFIASFFILCTGYGYSQTTSQPSLVITQQTDCPLLLLAMYVDSSDPLRPNFHYSLTNITDKPIRAYAIQASDGVDGGGAVTTSLAQALSVKALLKPHESTQDEEGGRRYQTPPDKLELIVDFVEFADGTRWGKDKSRSGERVDAFRAGGKTALKKWREILMSEGVAGLERALEAKDLIEPESTPKSEYWGEGFKSGVNSLKFRLTRAKEKGGWDEVRRELDKPFDELDGRQEP